MGSLAEHDINGVTSIVLRLSCSVSSALVAMMAGTVHPNPSIIGRNAFPESPAFPMMPSMTYATLDIYPLSSRIASARNRITILGIKVRIPPTPAMMPSVIREIIHPAQPTAFRIVSASTDRNESTTSNPPFRKSPTLKVRKNTSPMIIRNTGTPQKECVNTLSIFSVKAAFFSL